LCNRRIITTPDQRFELVQRSRKRWSFASGIAPVAFNDPARRPLCSNWSIEPDGGAGPKPEHVRVVCRDGGEFPFPCLGAHLLRGLQLGTDPAADLGVAISESEPPGTAMVTGREIDDLVGDHVHGEVTVVNAVIPFINKDQRVTGSKPDQVSGAAEELKTLVPGLEWLNLFCGDLFDNLPGGQSGHPFPNVIGSRPQNIF
jgi:hypothetical protein